MYSPANSANTPVTGSPHARLLIVDDDPLVRELHSRVLSLAGYEVVTAENGADALERLAEEPFDLVLTDRNMPTLSGVNIVLALRSAGSRIPVVMVSGSVGSRPLPPAVNRQIFAALPKPARTSEVLSAVALALNADNPPSGYRAMRQLHYLEA